MGLYARFRALWQDGSAGGTPLSAAALNWMEDGIVAASDHGQLANLGLDHHAQYLLRTDAGAAYVARGSSDTSTTELRAALVETHERSTTLTHTNGKLTQVVEKAGATTVKTTTLAYTGDSLTTVTEVAGGRTVTTTLAYTGSDLTGTTRTVA